jgi:hypothetical protein
MLRACGQFLTHVRPVVQGSQIEIGAVFSTHELSQLDFRWDFWIHQ